MRAIVIKRSGSPYCYMCRPCAVCSTIPARSKMSDHPEFPGHWCALCNWANKELGHPLAQRRNIIGLSTEERFTRFVSPPDENGCMLWTGSLNRKGYGVFGVRRTKSEKSIGAHRMALEISTGEKSNGRHALHATTCPHKHCVAPSHLRWGTNAENMADRKSIGGYDRKISDEQVAEIRARYIAGESQAALAGVFGVDPSYISQIVTGRRRLNA
jgi:hypothetical protein